MNLFVAFSLKLLCVVTNIVILSICFIVQDLEKEELPSHMTRVSEAEIKRVSVIFGVLKLHIFGTIMEYHDALSVLLLRQLS